MALDPVSPDINIFDQLHAVFIDMLDASLFNFSVLARLDGYRWGQPVIVRCVIHCTNSFSSAWVKFWLASWARLPGFLLPLTRLYKVERRRQSQRCGRNLAYSGFLLFVVIWSSGWTSQAEPSHARAKPELSSARGSPSLTESDVSSACSSRVGLQLGEARLISNEELVAELKWEEEMNKLTMELYQGSLKIKCLMY